MIYDLGDVVPLGITLTDSAGAAADGGTVTCTITRPDGSSVTASVTHAGTGLYNVDYAPTIVGRYVVRWASTGANASAFVDEFTVRDITQMGPVSLDEVKAHLNIPTTTTTSDEELRRFIDSATDLAEQYCGVILGRRTFTETYNGGVDHLRLVHPKAISITSVVEAGVTLSATDYYLDDTGQRLFRMNGATNANVQYAGVWASGFGSVVVTYVAGFTNPPASVRMGVLEIIRHSWQTQRGSAVLTRNDDGTVPGSAYTIPNRAKEYLDPTSLPGLA